jgi:MFS family permease
VTSPASTRAQIGVLSLAIVLGMAPWFAATVVAEPLSASLRLGPGAGVWLTLAVQLGFVVGSVVSALLLLSDRLSARRLAMACASGAAVATALLAFPAVSAGPAISLRLLTGAMLAGVYPPGIKIAAGWTRQRRGTAIGILVGALTLGTASPHLLRAAVNPAWWRLVLVTAAFSALLSSVLFGSVVREGPYQAPSAPFDPGALRRVVRDRAVMLATGGYLGHMWELYAMWSTIGVFFAVVAGDHGIPPIWGSVLAFAVIGSGALGCVAAGLWADRIGRSRVTIVSMAVSGSCALIIGVISRVSFGGAVVIALVWGIAVVADSAQFSACVTELAPQEYVGTAVTMQTAAGFLLTMATIRLVPVWSASWGWQWAYVPLALGPALGIAAMRRLWIERRV